MNPHSMIALVLVAAGASAQPDATMSYEEALQHVRQGRGGEAVTVLQRLAEDDDARAQLALGAILIEGKVVPADRTQGYAWLQIASLGYGGTAHQTANQAAAHGMVQRAEHVLSGAELIHGERLGREFRDRRDAEWKDAVARALGNLLAASDAGTSVDRMTEPMARGKTVEVTAGCGLAPGRPGCTRLSSRKALAQARCNEPPVSKPDVIASGDPKSGARLELPPLKGPPPVTCSIRYQAHVDRHGFVCSLALVDGCGHPELERTMIDSVARWRFAPAKQHGEPVPSRHVGGVTVRRR